MKQTARVPEKTAAVWHDLEQLLSSFEMRLEQVPTVLCLLSC